MTEYNKTNPVSILTFAKRLEGKRLKDVMPFAFKDDGSVHGKSEVGDFYEEYFGIKKNSSPEPDFKEARVELKAVPIIRSVRKTRIKERTKISAINYEKLIKETWTTASIRKKVEHVLFIFYEHIPEKPKSEFVTLRVLLWDARVTDMKFFERDWTKIWTVVDEGRAHELSESLTTYIGACTSGIGRLVPQPKSKTLAKERSFSFKPTFTRQLWEERIEGVKFESLVNNLNILDVDDFEEKVLAHLKKFHGKSIGELAKGFGVSQPSSKQYKATIIRRCLGAKENSTKLEEFEKQGITVKIFPVNEKTRLPFEAISFPYFKHMELVQENWETSEFRAQVERILFVPLMGKDRKKPREFTIGNPFFWSPSREENETMKREWTEYVRLIKKGSADKLPKESSTEIVHVRPHGRNAADKDLAPGGKMVTKKCFWLNKGFLRKLMARNA